MTKVWFLDYIKLVLLICVRDAFWVNKIESQSLLEKQRRVSKCLELIYADLCGPMQIKSLAGSFVIVYWSLELGVFTGNKLENFEILQKIKAMVEDQSGRHIKVLCTYRGSKFVSKKFKLFYVTFWSKMELLSGRIEPLCR